jgi:hypothetical protein
MRWGNPRNSITAICVLRCRRHVYAYFGGFGSNLLGANSRPAPPEPDGSRSANFSQAIIHAKSLSAQSPKRSSSWFGQAVPVPKTALQDFDQVDEDFYKVYFRDVEIGEFDAEALRFRPVKVMR